jgi:hypothetical protein
LSCRKRFSDLLRLALEAGFLATLVLTFAGPACARDSGGESGLRREALARLDRGDAFGACGLLDTLLMRNQRDGVGAFWAARAREAAGRTEEARCRYLRIEGLAPGTREAELSRARRMRIERVQADVLSEDFPAAPAGAGGDSPPLPGSLLLLPPEDIGASGEHPPFALAWTDLLSDALRGSDLCPSPLPATLALLDLFHDGHAVRATEEAALHPVNTVEGLRARLRGLPAADGAPYLASGGGGWEADLAEALRRFQQDHSLPLTGEADLATEARLESEYREWLLLAPPPLDPRNLPEAARRLRAERVLRGIYRWDEGRVLVQLTLLDANGRAAGHEPITLTFAAEETPAMALRAATLLGASPPLPRVAPARLSPGEMESFASARLVLDRGTGRAAHGERAAPVARPRTATGVGGGPARVLDQHSDARSRRLARVSSAHVGRPRLDRNRARRSVARDPA